MEQARTIGLSFFIEKKVGKRRKNLSLSSCFLDLFGV